MQSSKALLTRSTNILGSLTIVRTNGSTNVYTIARTNAHTIDQLNAYTINQTPV
jgi:hypothetical protein